MTGMAYLNGAIVLEEAANVGIFDGGWLHGAGLFETMRAENGRVFRLESHVERLRHSAAKLLRPLDRGDLPPPDAFTDVLRANKMASARVRLTVTAGPMRGLDAEAGPRMTVCITAAPLAGYSSDTYANGVSVIVCPFRQNADDPTTGHKTIGYLPRLLGLRAAQSAGCLEAIWFTVSRQLAEGSISNVFLVSDGVLKTPPLDAPVLPGVTRGIILDLAREVGLQVRESPLNVNDLLDAHECFLTNTIMQVMPVVRVEKADVGDGKVGPITKRMREAYLQLVERECGNG
jgi:branched-chain amino acid aminotransferase